MKNKKILILGGTGFVGNVLNNILETENDVTLIGSSGDIKYKIHEGLKLNIEELIRQNDLIIYCAWDFKAKKKNYISSHFNAVEEIVKFCNRNKISFLFLSTMLSNRNSKSIYNKAKYICENLVLNNNQSVIKLSVLESNINKKGNLYLKISKTPTIFGYRILLKPNKAKFKTSSIHDLRSFFESFSFENSNTFIPETNSLTLSETIDKLLMGKNKYIFVNWKLVYYFFLLLETIGIKSRVNTDSIVSIWGE